MGATVRDTARTNQPAPSAAGNRLNNSGSGSVGGNNGSTVTGVIDITHASQITAPGTYRLGDHGTIIYAVRGRGMKFSAIIPNDPSGKLLGNFRAAS